MQDLHSEAFKDEKFRLKYAGTLQANLFVVVELIAADENLKVNRMLKISASLICL